MDVVSPPFTKLESRGCLHHCGLLWQKDRLMINFDSSAMIAVYGILARQSDKKSDRAKM